MTTTTDIWAEERRAYYGALADDTELELLARELEVLELRVGRRDAGQRWARRLGLEPEDAPLVETLLYDRARAWRVKAAQQICSRILRRSGLALAELPVCEVSGGALWR